LEQEIVNTFIDFLKIDKSEQIVILPIVISEKKKNSIVSRKPVS